MLGSYPDKIRAGAAVVVIYMTDEISAEMGPILQWLPDAGSICQLPAAEQSQVDAAVAAEIAQLKQANATAYLIGGVCNNQCGAQVGHGMNEIVAATGGQAYDICSPATVGISHIIGLVATP